MGGWARARSRARSRRRQRLGIRGAGGSRDDRRIIIASRLFPPEVGAAAFRLGHLATELLARGADVEVLTSRPPMARTGPVPPAGGALHISRWPVLRDRHGNVRGYLPYLSFDVPLLARLLARPAPAAYVVEPPPTTGLVVRLVAGLRRRPYLFYAADVLSDSAASAGVPAPVIAVLSRLESWVLRGAAAVLTVSPEVADRLTRLDTPTERITVVGNGIDTTVFTPDGDTAELDEPYFVYAGTMSEWQGADVFIEALSRHRATGGTGRLVFLGQGVDLPHLAHLAERLVPGAVDFLGVQPPEVAARWLRGAVAGLVSIKPGQGYDFARPTKVYAATACGTPVIFAGSPAVRALVTDARLGWGVDHDPVAVAAAYSAAYSAALAQPTRPDREAERRRLVDWTVEHASLAAVAKRAAGTVLDVAGPGRQEWMSAPSEA